MSSAVEFAVWAPARARVEVECGGRRAALERDERGWWRGGAELAAPGRDYAFCLDGGAPRPDPRAPWLPRGVHAPGRLYEHADFRWSDAGFHAPPLARAVLYELHVGTFSPAGTFDGARERLGHLAELGVTHVELMPVNSFPGRRGWGYDGVGLFAPHEPYGGPDALKRLVDACHREGLAALLDVVYNHLGPEGNYLPEFGPYLTDAYRTPWGAAPNLDGPESDEVRRFVLDNARAWLADYHFDGLRLDAVHGIVDRSAVHLLEELARETRALSAQLGRELVLVAESDQNDPRLLRAPEFGGYGLDAQWNDDFHHALHATLTGERGSYYADFGRLADLAKACERGFVLDGGWSRHRRRRHGRAADGIAPTRLVQFLQNHDQVGNRARGERIGALVSPGLARVGTALLLAAPSPPLLFQGEEWGASSPFLYFAEHGDPALVEAVRAGRRAELAALDPTAAGPDPESAEAFERSRLDWSEPAREPHRSHLEWVRAALALRARHAPAPGERALVAFDETRRWITLERGRLVCAANLAREAAAVPLPRADLCVALASAEGARVRDRALELPAESAAFLE